MALGERLKKKLEYRLEKEELDEFVARVGFATDESGSMDGLYSSGFMDSLNEILLPLAIKFDDNREMDMKAFDNNARDLEPMTEENYIGYVQRNIRVGGGTSFAPVIQSFVDDWFEESKVEKKTSFFSKLFSSDSTNQGYKPQKEQRPAYLILQTDGQLSDEDKTQELLNYIEDNLNMFITFIGVGNRRYFQFITDAADKFSNVNVIHITNNSLDEDVIYDGLVNDKVRDFFFKWEE